MALSAKNKIGFAYSTLKKPMNTASVEFRIWTRCNDLVASWTMNSISKEIATFLIYTTNAEAIWLDLKERFSQKNGPRIFQLQRSLSTLTQDNMPISQYFTRLKALWDELNNFKPLDLCDCCHCGKIKQILDLRGQEYTIQFLMGLNDSYSQIRGQILLHDPIPSITKVFSLIVQEEKQREISLSSLSHEIAALMTRTPPVGNRFSEPTKQSFVEKERPIYFHCKIPEQL
ncbi:uncharacterized protein LOC132162995 [Corylus avellana]|uniref:uncharacterized protein LOC132162995 n=1 Tax=Corylus avellana TaxID=13451 RepID=UPI00286BF280|nr:uncharacterized protein LOC132162995 [Corylus avellana]